MQTPLQIAYRNVRRSPAIVRSIEQRVDKLNQLYDRITACRVVLDMPHRNRATGNAYLVRIDLSLPGHEIVVNRESSAPEPATDLLGAIGLAFDVAQRRLEAFIRQRKQAATSRPWQEWPATV